MPSDEENDVAASPRALANNLASALKRAEGPYSPEEIEAAVEYLLLDLLDRRSERALARGADEGLD
jgi:hypothetical protein